MEWILKISAVESVSCVAFRFSNLIKKTTRATEKRDRETKAHGERRDRERE